MTNDQQQHQDRYNKRMLNYKPGIRRMNTKTSNNNNNDCIRIHRKTPITCVRYKYDIMCRLLQPKDTLCKLMFIFFFSFKFYYPLTLCRVAL